jgi:hypothetical protein
LLLVEDGLDHQGRVTMAALIKSMTQIVERQATAHHEQNKLGDALRAIENLINALHSLPAEAREDRKVGKALAEARQLLQMLDAEACRCAESTRPGILVSMAGLWTRAILPTTAASDTVRWNFVAEDAPRHLSIGHQNNSRGIFPWGFAVIHWYKFGVDASH